MADIVTLALENCVDVSIDNHCEEDYGCTHFATLTMGDGSTPTFSGLCYKELLPVYERLRKTDSEDYKHLVASSSGSCEEEDGMRLFY